MPRLKQRADGRYCVRYKSKFFYGSTQAEARAKRDAYISGAAQSFTPSTTTVRDFAGEWLPIAKASVTVNTYNDYANLLNKLITTLGDLPISSVTPIHIKSVYTAHFLNLSSSTVHRARMLYISMFDAAMESGLIRSNPAKQKTAQPHKAEAGTHRAITEEERSLIISTPHRMQLAALIMLYAGLRIGEVLALQSSDIDLARGLITVNKSLRFNGNSSSIVPPKSAAGYRQIPIVDFLRPYLSDLPEGYICTSTTGARMTSSAMSRAWDSYMSALSDARNGCTLRWHRDKPYVPVTIRPHDLRHSYCVMLRDAGVDLKLAMHWLGHSDEKMILRVYDHISEYRTATAISSVNTLLGSQTVVTPSP